MVTAIAVDEVTLVVPATVVVVVVAAVVVLIVVTLTSTLSSIQTALLGVESLDDSTNPATSAR